MAIPSPPSSTIMLCVITQDVITSHTNYASHCLASLQTTAKRAWSTRNALSLPFWHFLVFKQIGDFVTAWHKDIFYEGAHKGRYHHKDSISCCSPIHWWYSCTHELGPHTTLQTMETDAAHRCRCDTLTCQRKSAKSKSLVMQLHQEWSWGFYDGPSIALVEHMGSSFIYQCIQSRDSSIPENSLNSPSAKSIVVSSTLDSHKYFSPNTLTTLVASHHGL